MIVTKDSTNVSVTIRIIDSTDGTPETGVVWNTAGIDLWYRRDGALSVDITEATLSALTDAHSDGGFLHINDGNYRLDVPDAAFATGVDHVVIGGTVTGMVVISEHVDLTDVDLYDAVRGGMTALPNAAADAAGGLPISDAGGLDLDARIQTDIAAILVDVTGLNGDAMRGTDNAALASVVGALTDAAAAGDPTTADTVMQYLKQLVNVLVGTTGVTTFPASAAPANNVSLAEAIRAIYDDTNEIQVDTNALNDTKIPDTISLAAINAEADTALTDYDPPTRAELTTDINSILAVTGALADAAAAGEVTTTDTLVGYIKQLINILIGTPGVATYPAAAAPGNAVSLAEILREIYDDVTGLNGDAMRGTDSAALASVATEGRLAELDAANLPADVDAILLDTGTTLDGRIPAALVGGRMDANVGAISGDATAADRLEGMMDGVLVAQVNDAAATTTAFAADGFTEGTDDHFNGRLITFISGALSGQQTDITDYDAAGHVQGSQAFVVTALTEAPANNDFFVIH